MSRQTSLPITWPIQTPLEPETPWMPSPRRQDYTWMSRAEWWERFQKLMTDPAREGTQLVFMGDSITQGLPQLAPKVWSQTFGPLQPLCLGIGGDRTQHLLWRIEQGELRGLNPRVLVLLIGINNLNAGDHPSDCVRGIKAVLKRIREQLPDTRILLLGLLPSGETANDPVRAGIRAINEKLATLAETLCFYVDIGPCFLRDDGGVDAELMPDFLHPSERGYQLLARALLPHLSQFGFDVSSEGSVFTPGD